LSVSASLTNIDPPGWLDLGDEPRLTASHPVSSSPQLETLEMSNRSTIFHELYDRYSDDVYRFAFWLTGNPQDARDITSEAFVRIWTAPEEPRLESVKAYLFTIARNLHLKQKRRSSRLEGLDEEMPDTSASPDVMAEQVDDLRRTLAAVQQLP